MSRGSARKISTAAEEGQRNSRCAESRPVASTTPSTSDTTTASPNALSVSSAPPQHPLLYPAVGEGLPHVRGELTDPFQPEDHRSRHREPRRQRQYPVQPVPPPCAGAGRVEEDRGGAAHLGTASRLSSTRKTVLIAAMTTR
ncbi:hypothetical protein GCM10009863_58370 [Streptomyces axinellae]|uniref:Uncharacterized protein n=1 Tax=Streptomyces axinellae TaxID=552788 RepID=A0ABN3QT32_9ACTN